MPASLRRSRPTTSADPIASATKLDSASGDVLTLTASAGAGAIIITAIEVANVEGTFDLTFDADDVEGSFSASLCANSSTRLQTCKQAVAGPDAC